MSREEEEEEVRLKFNLYPPRFRGGSQAYTGLGVSHRELYIAKTRKPTHLRATDRRIEGATVCAKGSTEEKLHGTYFARDSYSLFD